MLSSNLRVPSGKNIKWRQSRHVAEEGVIKLARLPTLATAGAMFLLAGHSASLAQELKLPSTLTFTAYDTGSSGFNIAVAVGKMLKDKHNTDVRVLPAGNDVARLAPLKANRAQVAAMGVGIYFAQEAVFEFATKEWGPQPLQVLLAANACNALGLVVANDVGVKEMKDLKGKRIAFVVGSPALNQNAIAMIAFGGLGVNDVKIVEFASNAAMFKGMINNEADAAFSSTINGQTREVESSPRGIWWARTPHADKAGWDRIRKVGPFFLPHNATCGSGRAVADQSGGDADLSLSDLHVLCLGAGRPDLRDHQGDDHRLRRLQGWCARSRWTGAQGPEAAVGRSVACGRRQGPQGSGCVVRRR